MMNRSTQIMQTAMARNTGPVVTEIKPDYPTGYIVLADAQPDASFLSAGEAKGHRDELREMGHIVQIVPVVMDSTGALDAMFDALDDAARHKFPFAQRVGPARLAKIAASVGVRIA